MMARSNRFNQTPDTSMQDHHRQIDEALLRRTAGPYICASSGRRPISAKSRLRATRPKKINQPTQTAGCKMKSPSYRMWLLIQPMGLILS
jgi:hypothetical protein